MVSGTSGRITGAARTADSPTRFGQRAPLDPSSSAFYSLERECGVTVLRTGVVRCGRSLDRETLEQAMSGLLARYPVLTTRVHAASSDASRRYLREGLGSAAALPVEWNVLDCSARELDSVLQETEQRQLNAELDTGKHPPMRLCVSVWGRDFTHIQLVLAGALFDDRSCVILLGELLRACAHDPDRGGSGVSVPATVPANWEKAFDCHVPLSVKATARRLVERDNTAHAAAGAASQGDWRDWPNLSRFAGNLQRRDPRRQLELETYPRPLPPDQRNGEQSASGPVRWLQHTVPGRQLEALRAVTGAAGVGVEEAVDAALVLAQLDLAQAEGDRGRSRVLTVTHVTDLRPHVIDGNLDATPGQLSIGLGTLVPVADRGLLKAPNVFRFFGIQKAASAADWKERLQQFLLWDVLLEQVPEHYVGSFLRTFSPPALVQGDLVVSWPAPLVGWLDAVTGESLKVSRMDVAGTWPGRLSVYGAMTEGTLRLGATWNVREVVDSQAVNLWSRMLARLGELADRR